MSKTKWQAGDRLYQYTSPWLHVSPKVGLALRSTKKSLESDDKDRERLLAVLAPLSALQQAACDVLLDGLSYQEAADKNGLKMVSVREYVYKTQAKLRKQADQEWLERRVKNG